MKYESGYYTKFKKYGRIYKVKNMLEFISAFKLSYTYV